MIIYDKQKEGDSMETTINLAKLISTDIRSRANADLIRREMEKSNGQSMIIDMESVVFISRSFADELLEIQDTKRIRIINAHDSVKTMLDIVSKSRQKERVYKDSNSNVVVLNNMAALDSFFARI